MQNIFTQEDLDTELHYAIRNSDIRNVESCIKQGADVNHRSDYGLYTPLMICASLSTDPEILAVLIKNGAKRLFKSTSDKTALWYAYRNPHFTDKLDYVEDLLTVA